MRRLRADNGTLTIAAARAEIGMRLIERGQHLLAEPDDDMLSNLYGRLKTIHSQGYSWDAPDIEHGIGQGGRRRIRSFVRRWINEWDLRRLYPESEPHIEETELEFRYDEDTMLEQRPSDDADPRGIREEPGPPNLNQEP